jgi:hypothetical protein
MTKRKPAATKSDPAAPTPLDVIVQKDETNRQAICRKITGPFTRHAFVTGEACDRLLTSLEPDDKPGLTEFAWSIKERADRAASGDLGDLSALFMAQALSLDSIFTEYARIALVNVSSNTEASERYMRLAMKAQANSRATLEALSKLHQPREQTVRHVHVNEGGQAVIAEQFHHHSGGQTNAQTTKQPHAAGTAGTSAALPSQDQIGLTVPLTGRKRQSKV